MDTSQPVQIPPSMGIARNTPTLNTATASDLVV